MGEDHLDDSTLRLPLLLNSCLGVDLERAPTIRVSHKFLHDLHILPVRNQQRGKAVPKCVPADMLPNTSTRRRGPDNA